MRRLRLAVMGCASIARRRVLPAAVAHDDIELAAVASRSTATARQVAEQYGCQAVTGYPGLLARPDVDAIYIPLPLALHAAWIEAALRAGKHVLAEKPLAEDAGRTRELIRLAAREGLVLMENVMFVHHHQHVEARRLVDSGAIGALRSLQAEFSIPHFADNDIRYDPGLGGGALWDVGLYPIRAAQYFLGYGLEVAGAVLTTEPGRRVETAGTVRLRGPDGITAQLVFGIGRAYRNEYRLYGSGGAITVGRAFTPPADAPPALCIAGPAGDRPVLLAPDDQVRNTLRAFAAAVRAGTLPPAAVEACLRQAELVGAVRAAARREETKP